MVHILKGDITKVKTDAIVNAANTSLLGGGGVDGAIHRAGGPAILSDCLKIRAIQGGCATGEAVITTAGNLSAHQVIHTVGPIWDGMDKDNLDQLLANCYQNSLTLAHKNNLTTIAFPNISTGVYAFPKLRAAQIAMRTINAYLKTFPTAFESIIFVCFDEENYEIYCDLLSA